MFDWSRAGSIMMTQVAHGHGEAPAPEQEPSSFLQREAPNLIWPRDHSWFVASEVDFDSTLIGGRAGLIDAIIESSKLEAWRTRPNDSLADDADQVNAVSAD
jgi:hypothetical protein